MPLRDLDDPSAIGTYDVPESTKVVRSKKYVPALDGLRGVAILAVICYHVRGPEGAAILDRILAHADALGWAGVDLFFVLSGFLITGILLDARSRPRYFRTFFARRVLRIVPVYVAFLLFSMWVAPLLGLSTPAEALHLRKMQAWYWTYLLNVYVALHGWAAVGAGPTHLWSLAVEEQFYVLWPLVVLLASPRVLPKIAIGCIVAAEICRTGFALIQAPGEVNFVLLPTRMDTLAVGALLACAERNADLSSTIRRWLPPAMLASLAALLVTLVIEHTIDPQLPLAQLVALPAIAILSGAFVVHASKVGGVLNSSALRFVGRYSYGMYIWHLVVITGIAVYGPYVWKQLGTSQTLLSNLITLLTVVTLTVLVALLSWYVIERPFVRLKRLFVYA